MFGRKAKSGAPDADKKVDTTQKTEGNDSAATAIQCAYRQKIARRKVLELQRKVDMIAMKTDLEEDPTSYERDGFVAGNNSLNSAKMTSKEKADTEQKEKDKQWQKKTKHLWRCIEADSGRRPFVCRPCAVNQEAK